MIKVTAQNNTIKQLYMSSECDFPCWTRMTNFVKQDPLFSLANHLWTGLTTTLNYTDTQLITAHCGTD